MVSTAARGFSLLFKLFLKEHRRQDFSPPPVGRLIRAGLAIVNADGVVTGAPARCFDTRYGAVLVEISRRGSYFRAGSQLGGRMIRGLFRFIGVLLLAAGFIFLIYDGQRSIADQTVRLTRLGEFWNDINQASQQSLQTLVEANAPWLWNSAGKFILNQPTWAVLGVLGILLMLLFRPRKRLIGYARD
jgi:hypothetical protein